MACGCVVRRIKTSTLLRYIITGDRTEAVPRTIAIDKRITVAMFVLGVRAALVPISRRVIRASPHRERMQVGSYVLVFAPHRDDLRWLLLDGKDIIGVGHLKLARDGEYVAKAAAILRESLRGQGLYPQVLRAMKRRIGMNIYSDSRFIGIGVIRAWKRMGLFDPDRNAFKLRKRDNPSKGWHFTTGPLTYDDLRAVLTRMATEPVG